jgi:hypothetical protein
MVKPWSQYRLSLASGGNRSALRRVHHVTHIDAALRILDDGRIARSLIFDASILNQTRTTVVWMAPNVWVHGSRYGNVQFSFDFADLARGRTLYWVEAITGYSPHAVRFLLSARDVSALPVRPYDPETTKGPVRFRDGTWWWRSNLTPEFMIDDSIALEKCRKVEFIQHHPRYCAVDPKSCEFMNDPGHRAAARVMAWLLARDIDTVDEALREGPDLSQAADLGLTHLVTMLGAGNGRLKGPLRRKTRTEAALRAALLQLALGDQGAAKDTTRLIGSDEHVVRALVRLAKDHFGFRPQALVEG